MDLVTNLSSILAYGTGYGIAYAGEYRAEFNSAIRRGMGGPRVEIAPHFDAWMMGDRFGTVVFVGTKNIRIRMDRSGKVRTFRVGPDVVTFI